MIKPVEILFTQFMIPTWVNRISTGDIIDTFYKKQSIACKQKDANIKQIVAVDGTYINILNNIVAIALGKSI